MTHCVRCFEARPLDVFVDGVCEACNGEVPAVECDERATIRAQALHTADDIRAYHIYGRPERDRSEAEREWLVRYEKESLVGLADTAPAIPEFIDGTFFGTVGKREDATITVLGVTELEPGDYGRRFLVRMREAGGADVVWFTGEGLNLDDDVTYRVRATIKNHEVYRGRRQTVVQRVTVVETVGGATQTEEAT